MITLTYIATFFTHFAAVNFARKLKDSAMKPIFMPVPRKLSSSCGTCVKFLLDSDIEKFSQERIQDEDLDKVYIAENEEYIPVYENRP